MKTAYQLIQLATLATCFAVYVAATGEIHLTGMRRAMQTMAGGAGQNVVIEAMRMEAETQG